MASFRDLIERLLRQTRSARQRLEPQPPEPPVSDAAKRLGHEGTGVNFRILGYLAVGIIASAVVIHLLLLLFLAYEVKREDVAHGVSSSPVPVDRVFPEPRLQTAPALDLAREQAGEETLLHRYEWIDRTRGVIRMPIERAIEVEASRGSTIGRRP